MHHIPTKNNYSLYNSRNATLKLNLKIYICVCMYIWASQAVLVVKNLPASAGDERDRDLIPRSWRSPGGGHHNPLPYSCLENPMDRGAWQATVHGVAKNWTWLTFTYIVCIHFLLITSFWNNILLLIILSWASSCRCWFWLQTTCIQLFEVCVYLLCIFPLAKMFLYYQFHGTFLMELSLNTSK